MGTRGFVGYYPNSERKKALDARGVYNHFDSYPTGLLKDIVAKIRIEFEGDWKKFLAKYVDGRPEGGTNLDVDYIKQGNVGPDPHKTPPSLKSHDPLFCEWGYIIHEGGIDVFAHTEGKKGFGAKPLNYDPKKFYCWVWVERNVPFTIDDAAIKALEEKHYERRNAEEAALDVDAQ